MSVVRWGSDGSHVYVIYAVGDVLECCGCMLTGEMSSFRVPEDKPLEMVAHLLEHRAKGHTVPEWAIDSLRADAEAIP